MSAATAKINNDELKSKTPNKKCNIININELAQFKDRKSSKVVFDKYGLKKAYLQQVLKESGAEYAKNLFYTFSRCAKKEMRDNEDMAKFNEQQLMDMLREVDYTSLSSITSDVSRLSSYLDYCIEKNFVAVQYNLLREMPAFRFDNLKNYLNIYKGIDDYFSDKILDSVIKALVNPIDQALVALLSEGIKGKEMCEIASLTVNDIDWDTRTLRLRDEDGDISRMRRVSERTLMLLDKASKQKIYYTKNGNADGKEQMISVGEYVIRNHTTKYAGSKVKKSTLEAKLRFMSEEFGLRKFLSTNIYESAIINKSFQIMKMRGLKVDQPNNVLRIVQEALEWAGSESQSKAHVVREKINMIVKFKDEFKGTDILKKFGLDTE